ncbi:Hypothetical protein NTJ_10497 [Nesidiocoris tenuis]|uniref:Uncharacterized protein n=1 Tax=Nesidiocoris tenuis TaxID=355587 RepID=A0ABN7B0C2_9HEMI|nr:Hypothetical protein NTJ_10497 [Nesidiocoris tenuis]
MKNYTKGDPRIRPYVIPALLSYALYRFEPNYKVQLTRSQNGFLSIDMRPKQRVAPVRMFPYDCAVSSGTSRT